MKKIPKIILGWLSKPLGDFAVPRFFALSFIAFGAGWLISLALMIFLSDPANQVFLSMAPKASWTIGIYVNHIYTKVAWLPTCFFRFGVIGESVFAPYAIYRVMRFAIKVAKLACLRQHA